ncbi:MAG: Crp/Fnr family transcriptional regulator [Lachnospiraceae bacterium]|nr:Crp/Fnr family transcriptional regulator [Lachnospiraceae bacterium]
MRANVMEVLELLERDKKIYEIVKGCPYEILKTLKLKKYKAGEFILQQGEIYDTFYLMVEGYADIIVESSQGKKYYLCTYGKGQFIGEMEMFEQRPYMSRIEARGPVKTLELSREYYLRWLESDRDFNQYILRTLCSESYQTMTKMGNNTLYSLKQRICQFLVENTNEKGVANMPLSAEQLSERMGVTARSVNRVLKELKDQNILEIHKTNVVVKDYQQLLKVKDEN